MFKLGEKDYLLGSHPLFEMFRAVYRMPSQPYLIGGGLIMLGYYSAAVRRLHRAMPPELVAIRQKDQLCRLKQTLLGGGRRSAA
jgi:hypothetical protein